jgi:hypothetical protein
MNIFESFKDFLIGVSTVHYGIALSSTEVGTDVITKMHNISTNLILCMIFLGIGTFINYRKTS